jgi:hypothetical protein
MREVRGEDAEFRTNNCYRLCCLRRIFWVAVRKVPEGHFEVSLSSVFT